MKKILFLIPITLFFIILSGFTTQDYEEYVIEEFYKKVELPHGSLDEDGQSIECVYVKTEIETGKYEIEITDGPRDLYNIKGSNLYITFSRYYGYAGYGDAGILVVNSGYTSSKFYKED